MSGIASFLTTTFLLLFPNAATFTSAPSVPSPDTAVQTTTLPILVYHHVRDTRPYPKSTWSWKMSISPEKFDEHMRWIRDNGYTTVDLDTAAAILRGEFSGPAKPVVITFDDNNRSQYEPTMQILETYGHTAVFYIVTNRLKNPSFLTEEEILDMHRRGMDIQSHSITHATMTNLGAARLETELLESKSALETLLGKSIRHIAYPSTAHNKTVRDATKAAGYTTGSVMDPRWARHTDDFMKLPRIMMTDDTNLATVLP